MTEAEADAAQVALIEAYLARPILAVMADERESRSSRCPARDLLAQAIRVMGSMLDARREVSEPQNIKERTRQAYIDALDASGWVQKDAAKLLGVSSRVMCYRMKALGLDSLRAERLRAVFARPMK